MSFFSKSATQQYAAGVFRVIQWQLTTCQHQPPERTKNIPVTKKQFLLDFIDLLIAA